MKYDLHSGSIRKKKRPHLQYLNQHDRHNQSFPRRLDWHLKQVHQASSAPRTLTVTVASRKYPTLPRRETRQKSEYISLLAYAADVGRRHYVIRARFPVTSES